MTADPETAPSQVLVALDGSAMDTLRAADAATDTVAAIVEEARGLPGSLVTMGTHARHALAQIWMGSHAAETVRRCPAPVVVINPSTMPG